ncbi:phage tail tape measure protein [Mucilaginibacter sp. L196]|uniref:phage tail tape measure protein n=1 Tax=Mucilaginibacter sp. L196 TaxID=1641870 RepID=UPI00131DE483|nr:phage tail tape measure protein [Mucilaginibacter sp. L196]
MAATLTIPPIFTAFDKFSGVLDKMGDSLDKFQSKILPIVTAFDNFSGVLDKMGNSLDKVQSKTQKYYADLSKSAGNVGPNTKHIGASALSAGNTIAEPLIHAAKAAGNVRPNAKQTGASALSAGNTIAEPLIYAAKAAEDFGLQMTKVSTITAALKTIGGPVSEAYTEITDSINALLKPSKDMQKVFQQLSSKDGNDLIKKLVGMVPAFEGVSKATTKLGLSGAKAWGGKQGSSGASALTGTANKKFKHSPVLQANNGGGQAMLGTSNSQFKLSGNNVQAFATTVGNILPPVLSKLSGDLTSIVNKMLDWTNANPQLSSFISKTATYVGNFSNIISTLTGVVDTVKDAIQLWDEAMGALNLIMDANPVGLIIIGIVALIGLVYEVTKHWHQWGAAVSVLMGPLGLVISLVMTFIKYWDKIKNAFASDGIVAGIKMIGVAIADSVLYPLEQMLRILSKIPGLGFLNGAANGILKFRQNIGADVSDDPATKKPALPPPPQVNPKANSGTHTTQAGTLEVIIKDPGGHVKDIKQKNLKHNNAKVTHTTGQH